MIGFPSLKEWPGLFRLAARVLHSHLGGPPTAGTMCVVVRPDGFVLLVKASYRSMWSLPGGYADKDEDPAAAAAREVREETGITLAEIPRFIVSRDLGFRTDYFFAALADLADAAAPTTGWEISETKWTPWGARPTLNSVCAFVDSAVPGGVHALITEILA